jgi:hypothetical protein
MTPPVDCLAKTLGHLLITRNLAGRFALTGGGGDTAVLTL